MEDVRANEPGTPPNLPPSTVITAGSSVVLTSSFGVTGLLTGLLTGQVFDVFHHVENLEAPGAPRKTLAGGSFTVPAAAAAGVIAYTSPTYTTGATGSGADFEIPANFDAGTFRVLTHAHARNANIRSIVAAFHDGLVIEVI
jgi:hypothetical protein